MIKRLLIQLFMLSLASPAFGINTINGVSTPAAINNIATASVLDVNSIPETTLADWGQRKRIEIDYDTAIGGGNSVEHFPVTVFFDYTNGTTNAVMESLGVNNLRMMFTLSDGETPLYADIEKWTTADTTAVIHVSKANWVIDSKTCIYCYYDSTHANNSTYVGVTTSAAAKSVWNSNFVMVQHMADSTTSKIADATQYGNTCTKLAANEPIEAVGKIGKAQSIDGIDDRLLGVSDIIGTGIVSICAWIYPVGWGELNQGAIVTNGKAFFLLNIGRIVLTSDGLSTSAVGASGALALNEWRYICATRSSTGTNTNLYVNGVLSGTANQDSGIPASGLTNVQIGSYSGTRTFDGIIDEVRISNIIRSAVWTKAEYYSGVDGLLVYP